MAKFPESDYAKQAKADAEYNSTLDKLALLCEAIPSREEDEAGSRSSSRPASPLSEHGLFSDLTSRVDTADEVPLSRYTSHNPGHG